MSQLLAIDADQGSVHVVAATARGGTARIDKALSVSLGATLTPANAADLGKVLKDALKSAGIAAGPTIAVVGRDRVIVKDVKIPKVSPAEEPALVRFQASKDLTEAADAVVLDYFTLDRAEPDGQIKAVIASVRKDVLNVYKALAAAAGLKITGVTARPLGTVAVLERAIASGAVTVPEAKRASLGILTRGEKWGELLVIRDGQAVFSRTISATALNSEPMLLGEIRRNLAVYNGQNPQQLVEALYVAEASGPAGGWSGRIQAGLNVPVQAFDPLAGVEHDSPPDARGHFAALIGLLNQKARSQPLLLNFVAPRQPVTKDAVKRKILATAISLLAVLIIGGLGYGYYKVQGKQTQLLLLAKEKNDLDRTIKDMEEDEKRIKALKEWNDSRINWLEELYDLTDRVPNIDGMRLESLRVEPLTVQKNAKTKYVARMFLKVQTTDSKYMDTLQSALVSDKHYHNVVRQTKGGAGTGTFNRFNQAYELRADLEKRETKEYVRKLSVSAPAKPRRKGDSDSSEGFPNGVGGGFGGPDQ